MANHGAKFQSVNLNKSYGQQHPLSHHTHFQRFGGGGGFYGQATAAGRSRGGGGGMVVLSRNRSTPAKVAPKLSVPPPLNLPSLRKEHEKFDMLGPGGPGSGAGAASGSRPTSSGTGWTKTVATGFPEKNEGVVGATGVNGKGVDGASRLVGSYMPPARLNVVGVGPASTSQVSPTYAADKTMVLRGEDFPSLQAARPVSSDSLQKQKDGLNQKQKHAIGEESTKDNRGSHNLESLVDVQHLPSINADGNGVGEYGGKGQGMGSGQMAYRIQKEEDLHDPLPLVNVIPRSDWADDERDTGHTLVDRGRHVGLSSHENYWDRDFDLPRPSVLPRTPAQNQFGRWGQRDNETGKKYSSEVLKTDPYNKHVRATSHEGKEDNKWRTSMFSKDRFSSQVASHRGDVGATMAGHGDVVKENKHTSSHSGDIGQNDIITLNRDSAFAKRDLRHVEPQQRNFSTELYNNRGLKQRNGNAPEQSNMYKGDDFMNNSLSKSSATSRRKLPPVTDPILTLDRHFTRSDRSFSEDPFLRDFSSAGFDEREIFSSGLVGVIKRKKDAPRSTEFHDPVRESFEAELERVQKMQELERQRIIEEQERALEQACREEEERQRRIREEEELQRRLEKEAQEAAGRAEQERLEAIRRAEEQRIAREEEKRRIHEEEERRKQAAKQKLLELEAKMAQRESQVAKGDVPVSKTILNEKLEAIQDNHIPRNMDLDTWEDGKGATENVTLSGAYDSSLHGRHVDMNSEPYPFTESSANFTNRGKGNNSWRRDVFVNGDGFNSPLLGPVIGHYSPRRDTFDGSRAALQKEFHAGAMPSGPYSETRMRDPYLKEFGHERDNRWNLSGNINSYGKQRGEMDSEFPNCIADMYSDNGWGQVPSHGNSRPPYSEGLYPHSGDSEFHSYGRSRFSMRQPRVLPPPIGSAKRTNFNGVSERDDASTFVDNNQYAHAARTESHGQTDYYGSNQRGFEPSEVFELQQDNTVSKEQKLNDSARCYSQSSLSVSSPPVSPPQLSHDELDESGDSPVTSAAAEGKISFLIETASAVHNGESGKSTPVIASASVSAVEDEEWTLENDNKLLRQEEYYEDVDDSREEGVEREMDEENLDLNQKFGGLELEEREPSQFGDNVVIGFDQGVQVVIPSDDFENNSRAQEGSCGIPASAVGIMEETGVIEEFISDEQCALPAEESLEISGDRSLGKVPEKVSLQDSIFQSVDANLLDGAATSATTGLTSQRTIPSSDDDGAAAVSQTEIASLSSGSQGDLPVNLRFGLFSGPSLIPSPMPTIQIGSIQMPLHIHPFGTSVAHMPPSQPSVFQFGQVHYTTPIAQGILPMAPQSMPFVQPNMMGDFSLHQNVRCSVIHRPDLDASSQIVTKDEVPLLSLNKSPSSVSALPDQPNGRPPRGLDAVLHSGSLEENTVAQSSSGVSDKQMKSESGTQAGEEGCDHTVKGYISSKARESEIQPHHVRSTIHPVANEKNSVHRGASSFSGGRGRRVAYTVKNANPRSFFQNPDMAQKRPRRTVQRAEFRVRQNNDRRSSFVLVSNNASPDYKLNYEGKSSGVFTGSGSKRGTTSGRSTKQRLESEPTPPGNPISQNANSGDRAKELGKNLSTKSWNTFHPDEANLRTSTEEVVDAPLQSGVVHVFKQPGIEAPSDEDDFIEVRSKRQMLNDRREQKEKEIKEKSRTIKPPRKPHATRQKDVISRRHKNIRVPVSIEKSNRYPLEFVVSEGPHSTSNEVSTGFTTTASQPNIGSPTLNTEPKAIKPHQLDPVPAVSNCKTECDPRLTIGNNHQTQFDEALRLVGYDLPHSAVGGHSSTFSDPILPASAVLPTDKSYSSGASAVTSLLAEDQIQYSPKKSDLQLAPGISVSENDNPHYPGKEKLQTDSSVPIQDCEAEAAASAVAVAAITSDEVARKGLGSVNTKSLSSGEIDGIATGVVGGQPLTNQSCSDELLSVSLPADLSVETTPISLWSPVPSPQSSSSQMIPHFPGGPPSPFPFYEMNPLLGGPVFSSSSHEDSLGSSQPQKSAASNSGSLGNWQQFHSGVDSFYCPPAGYSAPFIGAPGGIPGVQGPPHMVLYNHFAPVGQYGHVGLSFMGTTFIPTGKQADWKNTSTSSSTSIGDGDINNTKITHGQRPAPNISAPVQHLAPGSPLLPLPSPLPMFDVSSFQIAPDLPVPTHWGHIPASPLDSVPVSQPLQPQREGAVPSQVNCEHSVDQPPSTNVFAKSRTPTSDNGSSPTIVADKNVVLFSAELGPVGPLVSSMDSSAPNVTVQSSSGIPDTESGMTTTIETGKNQNASRFPQKSASVQQGNVTTGSNQRGRASQKTNARNEWTYRRTGFHGRDHHSTGKGYRGSKMKQIYVAKQTTTSSSAT